MLNPYEVMYDARMDVYRYHTVRDEAGYDREEELLAAAGVTCRYSISGQVAGGSPVPDLAAENQLFCGLDVDIREGDKVVVQLKNGQTVRLQVGEAHPYSFQYQCRVKREERA